MTTQPAPAPAAAPAYPTRFREGEERGARLGRALKWIAGVEELDEALMDRIGRAMHETDALGDRLARAMRAPSGSEQKVSMRQFHRALAEGIDAVPQAPPVLREFLEDAHTVPDWVDFDRVRRGQDAYRRLGKNASDVLLQLSLVGGYRFGGPTDLLVATGGLTGDMTLRRLGETQKWGVALTEPGSLRPGGEAWRLTVHVRAMHALVNASFVDQWDVARWGQPINQADQAATLGLFDGVLLIGARALGVRITRQQSRDVMHMWRWIGHLMGVHPDFLVDDERTRHRINYHVLRAQGPLTEAGPRLARAVVDAQADRTYPGWTRALQPVRAAYERERLLSMLTVFLGPESMREFGLPRRPPWAHAYLGLVNQWRYRVLARTPWGRARLDAWGRRNSRHLLASYFGEDDPAVAELRT
ncbi:DUF2236 domain-containing protein [Nocardioides panacisoli]|uniref:oxygenase MpaB family protein n=1 Tax=Nocardioides panacisoli TaxID=627624 RepID=UPI001C631A39|nr:oxygenase MpaB family protein [Nocardioides panacisoli]QYJ04153.1 DUF2236 domain-containing protein [Nocardioides panacisoli]